VWSPRPGLDISGRIVALAGAYGRPGASMTVERDDGQFFKNLAQRVLEEPFWRYEEIRP
jgi:hypothetical protein